MTEETGVGERLALTRWVIADFEARARRTAARLITAGGTVPEIATRLDEWAASAAESAQEHRDLAAGHERRQQVLERASRRLRMGLPPLDDTDRTESGS